MRVRAVLAVLLFRGFCVDDDGPRLWMGSAKGPFHLLCSVQWKYVR